MATRGCIARRTGEHSFAGIYHHWDSYPSGLGKTLFGLYNGFFQRDLDAMLRMLLDEHPAGWSTINGADFSLPAGYVNDPIDRISDEVATGPRCYCHGDRHETSDGHVTEKNADETGCEYVYILDAQERVGECSQQVVVPAVRMLIATSYRGKASFPDKFGKFRTIKIVNLDDDEPIWDVNDE